ncbi:SMAD/FHA domain-containing protein [Apodospora peruviana]|uniref:SMAD/FHA domain-containing protein n=1 Tax=Apodospora peruviana TaxID=516989 RepID=A0AAE0IBI1_9PEZI|nr:SMAD/FHA domain-containing protein [Apodospora peruviana]
MGSQSPDGSHRSRRRKDQDDHYVSDRKRRHHDEEPREHRRRYRSRSREAQCVRRSRTPESRDRRSRSRDKAKARDLDRDRGSKRHGSRERERRHRRDPDEQRSRRDRDQDDNLDRDRRRQRSREDRRSRRPEENDFVPKSENKQSLVKRSGPLPSQGDSFAVSTGEEPEKPIEKPNFGTTGTLAAASNAVVQADGSIVTLKYHEPPEARKPAPRDVWKLFVFKGSDIIDTIELSLRSCWLIGRDAALVDLAAEHPSISKQHAVIQFRYTEKRNEFGDKIGRVKPYLIDLESANGTSLNNEKVPDSRYLELRDKDMIQFGLSTREYVLMLAPKE